MSSLKLLLASVLLLVGCNTEVQNLKPEEPINEVEVIEQQDQEHVEEVPVPPSIEKEVADPLPVPIPIPIVPAREPEPIVPYNYPFVPSYGNYSDKEHCEDAERKCKLECDSEIYDYDSGEYLYNTDVESSCEDACRAGAKACDYEDDPEDGCWYFKRKCQSECDSEIYDYDSGEYLYNTDVESSCEDACNYGYRRCDN